MNSKQSLLAKKETINALQFDKKQKKRKNPKLETKRDGAVLSRWKMNHTKLLPHVLTGQDRTTS